MVRASLYVRGCKVVIRARSAACAVAVAVPPPGTLANEAGEYDIRVNAVLPGTTNTPLAMNPATFRLFRPDLENPTVDDVRGTMQGLALLPTPWVESEDITNAVLWLASDESRFVTGVELPVDGGWHAKF